MLRPNGERRCGPRELNHPSRRCFNTNHAKIHHEQFTCAICSQSHQRRIVPYGATDAYKVQLSTDQYY